MFILQHFISALAIKCYQCQPDAGDVASVMAKAAQEGKTGELSFCGNPTQTFDCSQDPIIGQIADSCLTVSISINTSMVGMISYNMLNCSVLSGCSIMKNISCGFQETIFQVIPMMEIIQCDVTCCKGDLCNNPSGGKLSSVSTLRSSNAVIFSIVCFIYLALTKFF